MESGIVALGGNLSPFAFSNVDKPVDEMVIVDLNVVHF